MHYYNDNDAKICAWLRELIRCGHLPAGHVDDRSIHDVKPSDLAGFVQCHFFAGIGGWPLALQLAGWPVTEPVWTASCPCQPFSCAGKGKGTRDKRHLWPVLKKLVAQCHPPILFGEQVASKAGRLWLARIRAEMETLAYAFGAADLCAAGISAPMVSQRLHWVAAANVNGGRIQMQVGQEKERIASWRPGANVGMAPSNYHHEHWWCGPLQVGRNCIAGEIERSGRKYRAQWRVKPGLPLLADGVPGRVAQLCGFGNAIVPQLAAEFIASFRETQT